MRFPQFLRVTTKLDSRLREKSFLPVAESYFRQWREVISASGRNDGLEGI
jgi:hypothetical protein